MSWDATPWFVGGGAVHSPEVARLVAYAFGKSEGVISTGDLKVAPLSVPGSSVRVFPGAAIMLARATGGAQQAYVARNPTEDIVDIAPTGSSGGRSDLIIARIEDPFMPGEPWATPGDPTKAQYVYTRVVPNVSSTAKAMPAGQTGVVLARVDVPANTATITSAMITDLRDLASPRSSFETLMRQPDPGTYDNLTSTSYVTWPKSYTPTIDVPAWATHYSLIAHLTGLGAVGGSAVGSIRVRFGSSISSAVGYDTTNVTDGNRISTMVAGAAPLGAMAGTTQTIKLEGLRSASPGLIRSQPGTTVVFDVRFYERAV